SDDWCDGVDHHDCPAWMKSPQGSTEVDNCICHGGHAQNGTHGTGTTCPVCPPGSWCDLTGQHSCPDGMTSNLASRSQEDCYCLEGYTGDVNCETRTNTTHHRCDPGYRYQGIVNDANTGKNYDKCRICSGGYWCDGTDYFECPRDKVGAVTNKEG
ncbi:hypothetical protein T484DRAFT_1758444, partial [Baffinella frigidus]